VNAARRRTWPLGLAAAAAAAPCVYAIARVIESRISPEADPAAVLWAEHSALQTRLMVAGYATAVLAGGTVALVSWRPRIAPRLVAALGAVSVLATLLVVLRWP
jgi:hypothetical protein